MREIFADLLGLVTMYADIMRTGGQRWWMLARGTPLVGESWHRPAALTMSYHYANQLTAGGRRRNDHDNDAAIPKAAYSPYPAARSGGHGSGRRSVHARCRR